MKIEQQTPEELREHQNKINKATQVVETARTTIGYPKFKLQFPQVKSGPNIDLTQLKEEEYQIGLLKVAQYRKKINHTLDFLRTQEEAIGTRLGLFQRLERAEESYAQVLKLEEEGLLTPEEVFKAQSYIDKLRADLGALQPNAEKEKPKLPEVQRPVAAEIQESLPGIPAEGQISFQEVESSRQKALEVYHIEFPGGLILKTRGRINRKYIELIKDSSKTNPIPAEVLQEAMKEEFGDDLKSHISLIRTNTNQTLARIGKKVEIIIIENKRYHYLVDYGNDLGKEGEDDREAVMNLGVPTDEELETIARKDAERLAEDRREELEEIEEIQYQPTQNEVRSVEENRVLGVICSWLNAHNTIHYQSILEQLRVPERMRNIGGVLKYEYYRGKELRGIFTGALKKIREEVEVPALRVRWTAEDEALWQTVESAKKNVSRDYPGNFIRAVAIKIRNSEKDFQEQHPEVKASFFID